MKSSWPSIDAKFAQGFKEKSSLVSKWFNLSFLTKKKGSLQDPRSPIMTKNNQGRCIHPSIHLFSAYLGLGHEGSSLSKDIQTSFSPATSSRLSKGTQKHSQGQPRDIIFPVYPESAPRPPSDGNTSPRRLLFWGLQWISLLHYLAHNIYMKYIW